MKRDELKSGDCVKVIRGKHKGKIGIYSGIDYDDYRAVRVILNGDHDDIPILLSSLEKCYK